MRTIAIINQKGGCGKTTVSINLAAVLASQGRRTLLVDMDPQAHCALGLAVPDSQIDKTIGDMLKAGLSGTLSFSDVVWQITRHLDLAPASMALAGLDQELAQSPDRDRRLAQVLATVADQYEFCIIDCPPSINLLTFNAMRASDEVLVPVETGYFSMQGSMKQEATIQMLARRAGHHLRFKVLATMYDVRTKLAREILSELRRHFGEKLLPVVVHFNSKLKEAASFGQPITEYDPASRGHQDFDKLAAWLLANPPEPAPVAVMETAQSPMQGMAEPVGVGTLSAVAQPSSTNGHGHAPASGASGGGAANPALSRAAELVERARALSARTAALSSKLAADPELKAERVAPAPPQPPVAPSAEREREPSPDLAEKLARLYGVRQTSQGLLFILPLVTARHVSIAGDFNNWSDSAHPMKKDDRLGVWQTVIPLAPGRYRYRFVIDGKWTQDPYNAYVETNPFGELNNVVEVGVD